MRTDRQTDRRTDVTKLIDAYRNFAKAPKNYQPSLKTFQKEFTRVTLVTLNNNLDV